MSDRRARDFLYKVIAELYNRSKYIEVLDYPRSMNRRSIDLAVQLNNGKFLLIKVAHDLEEVSKGEIEELLGLSLRLNIPSLIISEKNKGILMIDGIVYEKNGAKAVKLETLVSALENNDVFIYQDKESFKVKINPEKLKEKRMERNMSLGEIASLLHVSRRSVYEYERGTIEPSIELGEKLVNIFGDDILKPIDIFSEENLENVQIEEQPVDVVEERIISNQLKELGFITYHAKRTVLDIGAKNNKGNRLLIIVRHGKEGPSALSTKAQNLEKLSDTTNSASYVVSNDKNLIKELEIEKAKALTLEEFIEFLRDSFGNK
ncbi:putative transcriptional regulator [Caldisphaera lagunensis DSM 15908]|uniref:Putative HTH-type transcriptional regulatory protein Calag_1191 n=1 Tax=Caldisphaera lagunensis (strain DSM 15908 / JCM 11604 / ANMR 0165 / IC-154) TaxID=1056495 RepID=L0AAK2_CALLD|nr:helix-turn-helix domain-containing protein [Caldisphaera lagunensis]AFZ70911.1 putative transcriptional regulator [Caldisphaera lagunensis DSM 15908]